MKLFKNIIFFSLLITGQIAMPMSMHMSSKTKDRAKVAVITVLATLTISGGSFYLLVFKSEAFRSFILTHFNIIIAPGSGYYFLNLIALNSTIASKAYNLLLNQSTWADPRIMNRFIEQLSINLNFPGQPFRLGN